MLIYNFAASADAPTLKYCIQLLFNAYEKIPIHNVIWQPLIFFIPYMMLYNICMWFTYYPIAILLDIARICTGQCPRYVCNLSQKHMRVFYYLFLHI